MAAAVTGSLVWLLSMAAIRTWNRATCGANRAVSKNTCPKRRYTSENLHESDRYTDLQTYFTAVDVYLGVLVGPHRLYSFKLLLPPRRLTADHSLLGLLRLLGALRSSTSHFLFDDDLAVFVGILVGL